jgi:CRISPR/Cas system-associated protein Cas10 (large subunit of type III CRISPR-Cas system)
MKRIGGFFHGIFVTSHPRNKYCLWCGREVAVGEGTRTNRGVYCDDDHAAKDAGNLAGT